jgi:hypothetical protein
MFVPKNMDVNSNLLKLKLDMVYRELPLEEAEKVFAEVTATVKPEENILLQKAGVRRKVVKPLPRKSK